MANTLTLSHVAAKIADVRAHVDTMRQGHLEAVARATVDTQPTPSRAPERK